MPKTIFPTVIELSDLNGENGLKFNGQEDSDHSGFSISYVGDINDDGFDDIIIGADKVNPDGKPGGARIDAGSSYVLFGHNNTWTMPFELSALDGNNGFKINGEAIGDRSGFSVSDAGDVNGDGINDLIIGAPYTKPGGVIYAGSSYVVFGHKNPWTTPFELSTLNGVNGFRINGEATQDRSGHFVTKAGDINDDGYDDIIICAPYADPDGARGEAGSSYVIFGSGTWSTPFALSSLNGANGFKINGEAADDESGVSASLAGDMNGDGIDDLIIGAYLSDPDGSRQNAGSSYVIFGHKNPWSSPLELSTLNGNTGIRIDGAAQNIYSGYSVSGIGDINGDGFDDVIIGAPGADSFNGAAYVFFGHNSTWTTPFELSALNGANGFKINGEISGAQIASAVGGAGDVNHDEFDDFVIGAKVTTVDGKTSTGMTYIIFGHNDTWTTPFELSALNGANGFKLIGENTWDYSGCSVSLAGDINGDGIDDIVIGAESADPNAVSMAGSTYVIFGDAYTAKLVANQLTLNEGEIKNITLSELNAIDSYHSDIRFEISALAHGYFENVSNVSQPITVFSQYDVENGETRFVHDGTELPPAYNVTICTAKFARSEPFPADINFTPVNDMPELIITATPLNYLENKIIVIDENIVIDDQDDSSLTNATVAITDNFYNDQDVLTFTDQLGISGDYDDMAGVLTLVGSSSVENYQLALRNVTYQNLSDNPSIDTRTITFIVNDGVFSSLPVTRDIIIISVNDAPVLVTTGVPLNYTENDAATIIDSGLIIYNDPDHDSFVNATVSIISHFNAPQDVLAFINQNGIIGSYDSDTGMLTLTGISSENNYQTALRNITYENLSDDPTTDKRTIEFIVSDGLSESVAVTRDINVIAVNDAPVITGTGGMLIYTENDAATVIDNNIIITDLDNVDVANATVAITNNFNNGQDMLSFSDQLGITSYYDDTAGVLALEGSSSLANYQTALRNVTYENLSDNPALGTRTVTFMVNDGFLNSLPVTRDIDIIAVNDKPVLVLSSTPLNYTENDAATVIDLGLIIYNDPDHDNLVNATVSIISHFNSAQDVLAFVNQNGIAGIYNSNTGILTLTGTSSENNYQTALRNVTYENLSDDPTTDKRTIEFIISDGVSESVAVSRDINMMAVNDAPVITGSGGTLSYRENDAATIIDNNIVISDLDNNNLTNATVSITNNFNSEQDILMFTNQNGIGGIYRNDTGILALTGVTALANYQTALRSVQYYNPSDKPTVDTRTIVFSVFDGALNSLSITRDIQVISVNDIPVLVTTDVPLNYTENDVPTSIDVGLIIDDPDHDNFVNATVSISSNFNVAQDVLAFTNQNGITGLYDSNMGILSLIGSSSEDNYQTALRNVTYENLSDDPTTGKRTIEFIVSDGLSESVAVTRDINIIAVNDAPVIVSAGGTLIYTENDAATVIDDNIIITDLDNLDITNATVALTNNFNNGQDILGFSDQLSIAGYYDGTAGVLALSGSSSLANYQTALRNVTYENLSDNPAFGTRTVTFMVNDGLLNSLPVTRDIDIIAVNDKPVLVLSGTPLNYTENDAATVIDLGLIIYNDPDHDNLVNATVSIISHFNSAQDVLAFVNQNGIAGIYNSNTGILALTGTSSENNYQTALRNVTYENLSDDPTTDKRTIEFIVSDGVSESVAVSRDINMMAVNDAPVITGSGGTLSYRENDAATIIDNNIVISDLDNNNLTNATVSITNNFNSEQDILAFTDQNGIGGIYHNDTGILALTGVTALANYQTALRSVQYYNPSDKPTVDTRTVEFSIYDGALNSLPVTRDIQVISVNDIPVLVTTDVPLNYTENDAATIVDSGLIIYNDPDHDSFVNATVSIISDFNAAQDVLAFTNQNGIAGIYDSITGMLALTGTSSENNYQAALRNVTYENLSDDPTEDARTIEFVVNDGAHKSIPVTRDINIIAVNDVPVIVGAGGTLIYTENDAATVIDDNIIITDLDNLDITNATVAITNNFNDGQDILSFSDQLGIVGYYNDTVGVLALEGSSSLANYQTALRNVTYENLSDNPALGIRTVTFAVNDGDGNSNTITKNINIVPINDRPILANNQLMIVEGGNVTLTSDELSAVDPDDDLVFTVSSVQRGQFQSLYSQQGVTTFTQQDISDGDIQFIHDGSNYAPSYLVRVNDGVLTNVNGYQPADIYFTAVNDAPVLTHNMLTISQAQKKVLTSMDLNAIDEETSHENLVFNLSNIQHGYFEDMQSGTRMTIFPQSKITHNDIQFVHDGSAQSPSYAVSVNDGAFSTSPALATVNFFETPKVFESIPESAGASSGAIIGAISGTIVLLLLAFRCYNSYQEKNRVKAYVDAVTNIIAELARQGDIDINLGQMTPIERSRIIDEITRQTDRILTPKYEQNCRGHFMRFFGTFWDPITPEAIASNAGNIAFAVKSTLEQNKVNAIPSMENAVDTAQTKDLSIEMVVLDKNEAKL